MFFERPLDGSPKEVTREFGELSFVLQKILLRDGRIRQCTWALSPSSKSVVELAATVSKLEPSECLYDRLSKEFGDSLDVEHGHSKGREFVLDAVWQFAKPSGGSLFVRSYDLGFEAGLRFSDHNELDRAAAPHVDFYHPKTEKVTGNFISVDNEGELRIDARFGSHGEKVFPPKEYISR